MAKPKKMPVVNLEAVNIPALLQRIQSLEEKLGSSKTTVTSRSAVKSAAEAPKNKKAKAEHIGEAGKASAKAKQQAGLNATKTITNITSRPKKTGKSAKAARRRNKARSPSTATSAGDNDNQEIITSKYFPASSLSELQVDGAKPSTTKPLRRSTRGAAKVKNDHDDATSGAVADIDDEQPVAQPGSGETLSELDSDWLEDYDTLEKPETTSKSRKRKPKPVAKASNRPNKRQKKGKAASTAVTDEIGAPTVMPAAPSTSTIIGANVRNTIADYTTAAPMASRSRPIVEESNEYVPKILTLAGLLESLHPDYIVGDALLAVLMHSGSTEDTGAYKMIRIALNKRGVPSLTDDVLRQRKREAIKLLSDRNGVTPLAARQAFEKKRGTKPRETAFGQARRAPKRNSTAASSNRTIETAASPSSPTLSPAPSPTPTDEHAIEHSSPVSAAASPKKSPATVEAQSVATSDSSGIVSSEAESDAESEADDEADVGVCDRGVSIGLGAGDSASEEEDFSDAPGSDIEEASSEASSSRLRYASLDRHAERSVDAMISGTHAADSDMDMLSNASSITDDEAPTESRTTEEAPAMPPPITPIRTDHSYSFRAFTEPIRRDSLPGSAAAIDERLEPTTPVYDLSPVERRRTQELPSAGMEDYFETGWTFGDARPAA